MADGIRIDLAKVRARLKPQKDPYWRPLRRGLALGFNVKLNSRTWVGRAYVEPQPGEKRKYPLVHTTLGDEHDLSYEQALDKADAWFKNLRSDKPRGYDVCDAIEDYARTKVAEAEEESNRALSPEDTAALHVWSDLYSLTKHITGELLARPVADLKKDELERWRNSLKVKPATRRRIFTTLAAALSNASELHDVGDTKVWRGRRIKRSKAMKVRKEERSRMFIPSDAELAALLGKCEPDFAALVRGDVHTGMRYGEIAGLEVRDFNPARGIVTVRDGKTGGRDVRLSDEAIQFFKEQVKGKTPKALIFPRADGGPWLKSMQHRRMRDATKIRAFIFYSLRHYYISRQLAAGVPTVQVAKNCGTSEAMIRAHYHHWVHDEADRSVFNRVSFAGALGVAS